MRQSVMQFAESMREVLYHSPRRGGLGLPRRTQLGGLATYVVCIALLSWIGITMLGIAGLLLGTALGILIGSIVVRALFNRARKGADGL